MFTQKSLSYDFMALEPFIDGNTMEIHYGAHHAGYVSKLNAALEGHEDLQGMSIEELLSKITTLPEDIQKAVRNNGGGHFNHEFFWESLMPGGSDPKGGVLEAIESKYGNFDSFKQEFNNAALARFGSGWAWLIKKDDGSIDIVSTPNQDNTIMDLAEVKGKPLFGVDVWEHAYYLKYQNKRNDYLDAIWNVINWDKVSERYEG